MFKAKEILIESAASFLLGGLPAIVTYCYGGAEALKEFTKDSLNKRLGRADFRA